MAGSCFLSIIIPSYNETENLKRGVLAEVKTYLDTQKFSYEVIVSDDGSPSIESRQLAKDYCDKTVNFVYLQNEHGGKPFALWAGIQKAVGEIVLITDMDQSAPISELPKLLPYFNQTYDIVIGSRGTDRKNFSLLRQVGSSIFRIFRQLFILPKVTDTQAGFKSFKREVALKVFPKIQIIKESTKTHKGWSVGSWDAEFLFVANKIGYKIKEVPILWENRDLAMETKNSSSSGKYLKESLEMVQQTLRVKFNDLKGYYR